MKAKEIKNNEYKQTKEELDRCTIAPHPEMVRNFESDDPCEA